MEFSTVKIRAFYNFYDGDIEKTFTEGVFSLGKYHTRWTDIEEEDFDKFSYEKINGTRGYYCTPTVWTGTDRTADVKSVILDESAKEAQLVDESLFWFDKLINFCEEKGLNLILIKTPAENWSSSLHNAVEALADSYSLPFYDFNFAPLYDELDFIDSFDCADKGTHMNFYGSTKFSRYMGKLLTEEYSATDVRSDSDYDYMKEHVEKFDDVFTRRMNLQQTTDAADYITSAVYESSTVFITVKDAAAKSFTYEQREKVKKLGLTKLSEINSDDSYLAVIENGSVIYEEIKSSTDDSDKNSLEYSGKTADKTPYSLVSGGNKHGNTASCVINGEDEAKNYRGLNIVVYDNEHHTVIDSARFDTYLLEERSVYNPDSIRLIKDGNVTDEMREDSYFSMVIERYDAIAEKRAEEEYTLSIKNNYIFDFLDYYRSNENVIIVLAAMDEISVALTDENREDLREYGLSELSSIGFRESYVAIIEENSIIYEASGTADETITYEKDGIFVKSSGWGAENTVSVMIDGEECSAVRRGINAVVYDTAENKVIESVFFDTYSDPIRVR